ncbi:ATP-binding protein [Methanomethylovorans sp.]|uniref:ATP-binding protein n=1 Tax=Methanomethylovorans sp. TaxID=2758717 RepID=UPI003D1275FD
MQSHPNNVTLQKKDPPMDKRPSERERGTEKLASSESCSMTHETYFISTVEKSPFGVFFVNKDCQIEYCNKATLSLLGYKDAGQFRQECFDKFLAPALKEKIKGNCVQKNSTKTETEFYQSCTSGDGSEFLARLKVVIMKNEISGDIGLVCYIEDASGHILQMSDIGYNNKYVRLLEAANDGVLIIQDHVFKHVDSKFVRNTGYIKEDVLGRSFLDLVTPEYKRIFAQMYNKKMLSEEVPSNFEVDLVSRNGKLISMEISAYLIEFNGKVADMLVLRDISEMKKAEKELQTCSEQILVTNEIIKRKFELEKTISFVSTILVAPDDIIVAVNKCLERAGLLCGASRVYLFRINSTKMTMDNTHEWCNTGVEPQKDNLQDLPVDMFPWWMDKLNKGDIIHITDVSSMPPEAANEKDILEMQQISSLIVLPLYIAGKMTGFVGMDNVVNTGGWKEEDIKVLGILANLIGSAIERKENEDALNNYSANLARAYDELKNLDIMKNEFLATLNHELKTPLHAIQGYSGLLREGDFGELNADQKKSVDAVARNTERLGTLINSMLYMGNVLAGKVNYNFDLVQLGILIDQTIRRYSYAAQLKNIQVIRNIKGPLPIIEADINILPQLFYNIMDNALKFTPKDGIVTISASEEDSGIHIQVQDTGIGIPEKIGEKIFDKFYQVDGSSTRKYGGSGLGLSISRQIVQVHNGSIWIESKEGAGTILHVRLPKKHLNNVNTNSLNSVA